MEMVRVLMRVGVLGLLLSISASLSASDDNAIIGVLVEKFLLPILKVKVAELDKANPTEIHYGLQGNSVGRNGLREEVENKDIIRDGNKVNETRYNFLDKFAWSEKGQTWGPPGFQYYIFRHPLDLTFDRKTLEFTLATKLEFKVAVAINYDTGAILKPWVFADSGFRGDWPNEVDVSIRSKLSLSEDGKLRTNMTTHVAPKKPIVLQTLHGLAKKDCSPEVIQFLQAEMDKIAAKLDAEVQKLQGDPASERN